MSIISGIKTWIATNAAVVNEPLWTDYLGEAPAEFSVSPVPGTRTLEEFLNGSRTIEYPFTLNATLSTASEAERLDNLGIFEQIAAWMDTQTAAGTLPTLGTKQTATKVEATGWGYMFQEGEAGTAIYQVQCLLTYHQAA